MGANGVPSRPDGKTLGDVLDGILTTPGRWLAFLGLLTGLSALVILVMWVVTRLFGVETTEVKLGSSDSHIVFSRVDRQTGAGEYLAVVDPQGWQNTTIAISPGDRVTFSAGGRVCIDVDNIIEMAKNRLEYENEIAKKLSISRNDPNEKRVPEDFFTEEQRRSLILSRPWVDPDGFDLSRFQPAFRSRRSRYLLPDKPAAGLVAAITSQTAMPPARPDAFFVGRGPMEYRYTSKENGVLWFTVNDLQFDDPNNPNLFYNDNIGSYWVRVTVTHS